MHRIHRGQLDPADVDVIERRLRALDVRRTFRSAQIYFPKARQYRASTARTGLKATFHDTEGVLIDTVRSALPSNVELPAHFHLDLLRYADGDHFAAHRDLVRHFPHGAVQVTVLIGLRDAARGGTCVHLASDAPPQLCHETRRKGGVLAFESHLLHAGESVTGVKEVLVCTGFAYDHQGLVGESCVRGKDLEDVYKARAPALAPVANFAHPAFTHSCGWYDWLTVLSVHRTYEAPHADTDEECDDEPPHFHFYTNDRHIASHRADAWHRYTGPRQVSDMRSEQVARMRTHDPALDVPHRPYPLLADLCGRVGLERVNAQAKCRNIQTQTRFATSREFCNGGNDYDVVKIPALHIRTFCKHFHLAVYGRAYYAHWLTAYGHRTSRHLPSAAVNRILEYVAW